MGYSAQPKTRFNDLRTTKTGDVGEAIVQAYLQRQGWHVYPHAADLAAPVDFVTMKPKDGGFDIVAIEAKTYPRRFASDQTGIDSADYWTYREIIKTMEKLIIVFVDPFEECIYALPFHKVFERVTFDRTKCYFDLADCKKLRDLTRAEIGSIGWQKTIHYTNVQKFFI
jgi:hypothetical protein